ncbi:T9SS type A sorting domain-containing protein [Hymenobacter cheonanensis]|uniref:T9SS type A sorting domain-containing protein n=1 Tax=Hymenobacter sp. CA2-7 TaxID=3063993 RepID=UPI002712337E|nr:T9SS type A sorting domain-containing protein [Hymenobacter sp. CA2-7]MDO7884318.1 T9SS type A sorting domain-containing protein [Hymenobacter sp. CA2-7]
MSKLSTLLALALLSTGPVAMAQAPVITSQVPAANAVAAARSSNVAVTFDRALNAGSASALKVFSAQRGGLRSVSSGTTTASGSTVSFASTYAFRPGETVQATVTTAATAAAGGSLATPRVWQFTTAAGAGPGTFSSGSDPAVGTTPFSVAAADVNNDGYPDLLAANAYSSTVSVRLNSGSGTFGGSLNVPVGSFPFGVVAADVNGDGNLDLLTANNVSGTASVCLGTGNGTFGAASSVGAGAGAWTVATADLDGDGDLDMLVANHSTNTVSVRLNSGSGGFAGTANVVVGNNPFWVTPADVDGDGDLDFVTANEGSSTVSVRLNDGHGNFSGTTELPVGAAPQCVAAADLNGDGAVDLVSANHNGNNLSVLLNAGNGTFGAATSVAASAGGYTCGVTAADIDGDGDLDLLGVNNSTSTVSVRLNNGSGSFSGTTNVSVGVNPIVVVAADVDQDGDLDFLTANQTGNSVSVRLNQSAAPILTSLSPASGAVGSALTINGSNLTGATAITFAGSSGNIVTTGFTVNAAGTQITGVVVPGGATTGNVTVTTPGGPSNGMLFSVSGSLVITSVSPANGARAASAAGPVSATFSQAVTSGSTAALKVFSAQRGGLRSAGSGTTTASANTVSFAPTYAFRPGETVQATLTTAAVATAGGNLATPRVWQFTAAAGAARGAFTGGSDVAVGSGPSSTVVGDLDGDGDLDLLTTDYSNGTGSTVSVRFNTGNGTFSGGASYAVGAGPFGAALGDVDGDGDLDLLTTSYNTNTVSVRLNTGSGTFSGGSDLVVGANPYSVAVGDVDGDGDLDLLSAHPISNTVSVRFNNGSGGFSGSATVSMNGSPTSIVVGDVDGDGDLDLLTANTTSSSVNIRLNDGSGSFSGGSDLALGALPFRLVLGDVDGDGDLDLLTANTNASTVSVRLNTGSGTFSGGSDVAVSGGPTNIALGDVDGDGDLDLLAANQTISTVSVRLNTGSGSFTAGADPGVSANSYGVALGDVDGDGDLDLIATCYSANSISIRFNQPASLPSLTISTGTLANPTLIPPGTYNSITIIGNGVAQLTGSTTVNSAVTVSGTLLTNCQPLTGAASFTVAAGATLGICDPAGLSSAAGTGAVQTTGPRSFSAAASYLYNGTAAQATGNALPGQVLNLTISSPQTVTLTQPVQVKQVLTLAGAGNLDLNGQALTLLSDASGTALVVNSGTGVVQGRTGTMQRYIDASGNLSISGYRHYSAPVTGSTVGDLATGTFTPTLNTQYNTSTTPTAVTPFPTVFGYDETRLASSPATTLSAFDRGWYSPASLSDALAVGRGYTVELGNNELVDFTGTFTTGPQTLGGLTRGTDADAGWHLVGNPYPAPLDWGTVAESQLTGVLPAIYLYQSTGPYVGRYRSLVNGIGAGTGLIPAGQGFFVRASTAGATGSVALTNANRAITFAGQPALQRTAADLRPRLRLSLGAGSLPASPASALDETFVYLEVGATAAFDGAFDACKLANPSGYYLASASTDAPAQPLSINGRAPLGPAEEVVPLWLSVPTGGTYTLTATELANFTTSAGAATPYLRDALTGTLTNLSQQASYSFAVAAGAPAAGRFALLLRPAGPLATAPALAGALVSLYPNPAAAETTLSATGLPGLATTLDAVLLDAVGRQVGHYTLPVRQGAASQPLPTAGLASGIYLLRVSVRDARAQPLAQLPTQRLTIR